MAKEYVLPSLVIGPAMGAAVTAATTHSKKEFKDEIGKGIVAGTIGDVATGAAMGLWNQRKNIGKL